jgi:hypothetical protein
MVKHWGAPGRRDSLAESFSLISENYFLNGIGRIHYLENDVLTIEP